MRAMLLAGAFALNAAKFGLIGIASSTIGAN
jgi:hypothetical protein